MVIAHRFIRHILADSHRLYMVVPNRLLKDIKNDSYKAGTRDSY